MLKTPENFSGPFWDNLERTEAALVPTVVKCNTWESNDLLLNSVSVPGMSLITELMSVADTAVPDRCFNDETCVWKTESIIKELAINKTVY